MGIPNKMLNTLNWYLFFRFKQLRPWSFRIGEGSGGLSCANETSNFGKKVVVLDFVTPSEREETLGD